jgi:predicted transposase YdaD
LNKTKGCLIANFATVPKNLRMCKPPEHTLIGRSEGERQATLKIARTSAAEPGIDRNTVMKMTGLTEDDLAQIRH